MNIKQKDWLKLFAPTTIGELAVQPKKVQEVERWLLETSSSKSKTKLCILSGPSGSGKTAVVRVLAKVHQFHVQEWINNMERMANSVNEEYEWQNDELSLPQTTVFRNFLFKASRYGSILKPHNRRRLLLIEDMPNIINKNCSSFQNILEEYCNYCTKSPLILIISDGRDMSDGYYQLIESLKEQRDKCIHITFNAIANTLMQKAMKAFITHLRSNKMEYQTVYSVPSESIVDSIVMTAHGDIRNALINLHFACLRGAPNLEIALSSNEKLLPLKLKRPATRSKKKENHLLKTVGTKEYLNLPHALGRVFNPKFDLSGKLLYHPEEIIELFEIEPQRFIALLHANYHEHYTEMQPLAEAAKYFSLCGNLIEAYYNIETVSFGFDVIVRSLMVNNKKPASGWKPLKGCHKDNGKSIRNNAISSAHHHRVSSRQYLMDYKPFLTIIRSS